tara:strand:- start:491 stop:1105 length:615 start_codon:yes stop_codon:yes gene_type:complete
LNNKAVLFANGEKPDHKLLDIKLINESFIIGIDKGYEIAKDFGIKPHAIIGDLDSVNLENVEDHVKIIENKNKDNNDLEKTLIHCLGNNFDKITIFSCTGKKDDQNLANLLLCFDYSNDLEIEIITNYNIINFMSGYREFKSSEIKEISIISPNKETLIETTNLKYNLNNEKLASKSHGISNVVIDDKFTIKSSDKIIVFRSIK